MAGVKGRSGTNKGKDKPWAEALRMAVYEDGPDGVRYLRKLAEKCRDMALAGDQPSIKEIGDRLDGKPAQALEHSGDVTIRHEDALEQLDRAGEGDTPEASGQSDALCEGVSEDQEQGRLH